MMNVVYNFNTLKAGPFSIGGVNSSISLRPRLDLDYTLIVGRNCSQCASTNYDTAKSFELGYLKGTAETESRVVGSGGLSELILANGSFVSDTLSPNTIARD